MRMLVHFPDHEDVFKNVSIPGGVNYFLYEENYSGLVKFVTKRGDNAIAQDRKLFEDELDFVLADANLYGALQKVTKDNFSSMMDIIGEWNSFGVVGKKDILEKITKTKEFDGAVKVQCAYEEIRYIARNDIPKIKDQVDKWKVFTSRINATSPSPSIVAPLIILLLLINFPKDLITISC